MEEMRDRDEINTLVLNDDLERQNLNGISDDETNDDANNIMIFNVGDLERQNLSDYSDDETKEDMIISGVGENEMVNKLRRLDSFEKDACRVSQMSNTTKAASLAAVLKLAFQSIGVVYGDIGTSVLYLFPSVFSDKVPTHNNIVGALSLIIYSLTLFPLIKYVFVVLQANDNGDGGTFALYSLISRHLKVSAISTPSRQHGSEEMRLSENKNSKRAAKIKDFIENSSFAKTCLLILALLGTCMVIGDGILTPCISVLSAVDGVRKIDARLSKDVVVWISVAILIVLFSIQRFGTENVGYAFAPTILIWYLCIGIIGVFNLIKHDTMVLKAFNPFRIIQYFSQDPKEAWISLGGIILCMTGTEAMFADLGHFSVQSIQIAFTGLVYPCLLCAYIGQAAYLSKYPNNVSDAFYKSTPETMYWPMFIIAVLASIIASQAMISATLSIVKQAMVMGCFPRVRVIHTSEIHEGQIYIPEINFFLMFACALVVIGFKETSTIGNAYGIAVVVGELVTSSLVVLIMLMIWQTNLVLIVLFVLLFGSFELVYFSSVIYKFDKGGYLPLSFAGVLFFVMYVWHYVQTKRHNFEIKNQAVSIQCLANLQSDSSITRVPGVGLLYTESTHVKIPAIFSHFLSNLPAIHSVLVFVSVKHLPVKRVPTNEFFFFRRVGTKQVKMYKCVVRYGYRDTELVNEEFEDLLMEYLKLFIQTENGNHKFGEKLEDVSKSQREEEEKEIEFLEESRKHGVTHMLGHSKAKASEGSCTLKRVIINNVYDFLETNFRQGFVGLQIPNNKLLHVRMIYDI